MAINAWVDKLLLNNKLSQDTDNVIPNHVRPGQKLLRARACVHKRGFWRLPDARACRPKRVGLLSYKVSSVMCHLKSARHQPLISRHPMCRRNVSSQPLIGRQLMCHRTSESARHQPPISRQAMCRRNVSSQSAHRQPLIGRQRMYENVSSQCVVTTFASSASNDVRKCVVAMCRHSLRVVSR